MPAVWVFRSKRSGRSGWICVWSFPINLKKKKEPNDHRNLDSFTMAERDGRNLYNPKKPSEVNKMNYLRPILLNTETYTIKFWNIIFLLNPVCSTLI